MTTPGARSAQQAYQQQVQRSSADFCRTATYQDQLRYRRRNPGGPIGVIRRLLALLFSVTFLVIAAVILLAIMRVAQPNLVDHAWTWFTHLF